MRMRVGAALLVLGAGLTGGQAAAKTLPGVALTPANQPRQCTTPGRLMAFIEKRNPRLQSKFAKIAVDYMRNGRDLGVRWDYAFFQMVVETNSLQFTGDVRSAQNNFAGLGATGGGVKGEYFRSVSDGVRAHLQHLMLYAGLPVDDPVADRTRKVQSWGILDKWRARYRRPITFGDVGSKWAPVDRRYGDDIEAIAKAFYAGQCNRSDPAPELLAEALGRTKVALTDQTRRTSDASTRQYDFNRRAGLGAGSLAGGQAAGYNLLNAAATGDDPSLPPLPGRYKISSAAKFAAPAIRPGSDREVCKVWTASYGGQKAVIIRAKARDVTNYTVLDVHRGNEAAEAHAYIQAYAKGGTQIASFANKTRAMERAFKLCPAG